MANFTPKGWTKTDHDLHRRLVADGLDVDLGPARVSGVAGAAEETIVPVEVHHLLGGVVVDLHFSFIVLR